MAPTEILAEQHYHTIHRAFEDMGVTVAFLRGGMGKERTGILKDIKEGKTKVVVGTHALIQETVLFENLGLVVVDEQHRFGVMQRKSLKEKGPDSIPTDEGRRTMDANAPKLKTPVPTKEGQHSTLNTAVIPHTLVMTATPIPRTLSMVVYGDLDVSIIDEMPKGRQKVWTKVLLDKDRSRAYKMVEDELKQGRQAFIVYPLVEESEKVELLNAKEMAVHLQKSVFPSHRIGLLHGRMRPDEKEEMMLRFKDRGGRYPRLHDRYRSRHRRPQRHDHHSGARRTFRAFPAPPVAGQGGPERTPIQVYPRHIRKKDSPGHEETQGYGGDDRRVQGCRGRYEVTGARRHPRRETGRAAGFQDRRHSEGCAHHGGSQRNGRPGNSRNDRRGIAQGTGE